MEAKKIKQNDYENFLSSYGMEYTIFHELWWLNSISSIKKYPLDLWAVYNNNDEIIAVLPILFKKIFTFKFVTPYLTPYLGPVFSSEVFKGKGVSVISKIKEINSLFAKIFKKYYTVVYYPFSSWHTDLQPYKWAGFNIGVHYTYVIDLNKSMDDIWNNMDKKRRNDIRKAKTLNPKIVEDDIESFVELNSLTFKRQKKNYNLCRIWKGLFKECSKRGQCKIWTAYVNGEPLASLFLVWDKVRAYYLGGGINENSQGLMSLLMWNAITYSKNKGLKIFDFEGSDIPSIEQYFSKFVGKIKPIFHIKLNVASLVIK